jgi:hypothetical protein
MKALTSLLVLVGLASVIPIARGGTDVDCSSLSPWTRNHGHYSKGDRVWFKIPKYSHPAAFKCTESYCADAPDRSSDWTLLGECEYGTTP